jgi:hypothetical protein
LNLVSINHDVEYFRLIKMKMKIAYEALLHGQTVVEYFIVSPKYAKLNNFNRVLYLRHTYK